LACHFLSHLRLWLQAPKHKQQQITLSPIELADLSLWVDFLFAAHSGISLNRFTICAPSQLGWSDSCPFGLGGFTSNGTAWCLRLPPSSPLYGVSIANNILEFLALSITLWFLLQECQGQNLAEECLLVLGNSTSALGWLYSTFYCASVNLVASQIAHLILHSLHCLASQHIKGLLNVVSDLLSYSGSLRSSPHPLAANNPDDHVLTQHFHSHLPQLIPKTFSICPLPPKISSFAILVLQTAKLSFIQNKRVHMKAGITSGNTGSISATNWFLP
jgi:hypothetical protein